MRQRGIRDYPWQSNIHLCGLNNAPKHINIYNVHRRAFPIKLLDSPKDALPKETIPPPTIIRMKYPNNRKCWIYSKPIEILPSIDYRT